MSIFNASVVYLNKKYFCHYNKVNHYGGSESIFSNKDMSVLFYK